ncbi:hypothetical protein ASU31_18665 [Pedobacter ginsenosidimutans]|uniref:Uncharacterized protein n=1 Tax=Pedobacter ginsenosidimutans TaxID=687842 RepID=A0A0T5VLJ2_9SPHI|nr:hypothetical protein ASU31_18665 [Pedobacter ginsenosidimutans]
MSTHSPFTSGKRPAVAAQKAFSLSKNNALSELEAERISKDGIIYTYLADKKLGYGYDSRIDVYS